MLGVMRRGVLRVGIGGRQVPPLPLPPACRLLAALHRSGLAPGALTFTWKKVSR